MLAIIKEVLVPDLGGAAAAEIIEVPVKVGDKIAVEDSLIVLESEKASMEIPSPFAGVIKEMKVKKGDKVSSGKVILTLEVSGEEKAPAISIAKTAASPAATSPAATSSAMTKTTQMPVATATQPTQTAGDDYDDEGDVHAGPGVRRLAREFGIDLAAINGSGPKNRILKEDLQGFVKAAMAGKQGVGSGGMGLPTAPVVDFSQFGATENKPLTRIKRLTAVNLHRNWLLVPHVTQFADADISELEAFRKTQQPQAEKAGFKLTPLVFIMKAVVATLQAFPHFNASLSANGEELILKKYFHIGVAVDTPEGLVVPVIRDVDKKGLLTLAQELAAVSSKARAKNLTASEMQGGCFTISSLGGIGGTAFTPIVNVPEVAILGVSKANMKPVFQGGQFVPRLMLPLSLSYDHRVIDGAEGARFIMHLADCLTDIRRWLL